MIIVHERIHTLAASRARPTNPWGTVGAMRVLEGKVVALGSPEQVLRDREAGEEVVRPDAACILPGFIDTHAHVNSTGLRVGGLELSGCAPLHWAKAVGERARGLGSGQWIAGWSWDQNTWRPEDLRGHALGGFPTHHLLTEAAPDNPVALYRNDGHAMWINVAAARIAGIEPGMADPKGGRILWMDDGSLSGILIDEAMQLVERAMPDPRPEDVTAQIVRRSERFAEHGVTCVHSAQVPPSFLPLYERALASNVPPPIRLRAMVYLPAPELAEWAHHNRPTTLQQGAGPTRWQVTTLKAFADGALGSMGAWMFDEYEGHPGERGLSVADPEEIETLARVAARGGWQVATHAIGDRAVHEVIGAYLRASSQQPGAPARLRWRIEHAQHFRPEDVARAADAGICAAMQPIHCTQDMGFAGRLLGSRRLSWAYPWRSVHEAGVRMGFGSDYPIESLSPFEGIYAAVTRQDEAGHPEGGWYAKECLTMLDAVRYYTSAAANLMSGDAELGTLERVADFAALSVDPAVDAPTTVRGGEALWTVVDGQTAFSKEETGTHP